MAYDEAVHEARAAYNAAQAHADALLAEAIRLEEEAQAAGDDAPVEAEVVEETADEESEAS